MQFNRRIVIELGLLDIRKTAGLIPDGVIGIFHPSFHSAAGVDSAFNNWLPAVSGGGGGKGGWCVVLTTSLPLYADCLEILGASKSWSPKRLSRTEQG